MGSNVTHNKAVNGACGWAKHCVLCPLPWRYAAEIARATYLYKTTLSIKCIS